MAKADAGLCLVLHWILFSGWFVPKLACAYPRVKEVVILDGGEKYVRMRLDQAVLVQLKLDDKYYKETEYVENIQKIFYIVPDGFSNISKQRLGITMKWIMCHSTNRLKVYPVPTSGGQTAKSPQSQQVTSKCPHHDEIGKQTRHMKADAINFSYSGKPHDEQFIFSLIPFVDKQEGQCPETFLPCHISEGCVHKNIFCSSLNTCRKNPCDTNGGAAPSTSTSTNGSLEALPLGFIGAIVGLVITGLVFLAVVIVWYLWRARQQRRNRSITLVTETGEVCATATRMPNGVPQSQEWESGEVDPLNRSQDSDGLSSLNGPRIKVAQNPYVALPMKPQENGIA